MKYNKLLYMVILFLVLSIYAYAQNTRPTADAGEDRNVIAGKETRLSGSGADADNDPLTFRWQLIEKPSGSLSDFSEGEDEIPSPSFTPDEKGAYVFSLRTNDGKIFSIRSEIIITVVDEDPFNSQPVSYPGPNRNVNIEEELILAGTGSDADGDSLLYIWSLLSSPTGSKAMLSSTNIQSLPFTPDVEGEYLFNMIVNDGKDDSSPAEVKITASKDDVNRAPSADAGPNKTIKINDVATLAGTGSDPGKDSLTYTWAVVFKPVGSEGATLSNNNIPNPTFTPNVEDKYIFSLTVDDGKLDSEPYIVMYEAKTPPAGNDKPTADAGIDRSVDVGEEIELQGSGTDPDEDTLTFRWSITNMPTGSGAFLSNPHSQNPKFIPDVVGSYTFQLITNDNNEDSDPDSMNIDVAEPPVTEPVEICVQGTCNSDTKQWCNEEAWTDLNYCDNCENQDESCLTCTGNICDMANQKWCEDSLWKQGTYSQYCSHCSYTDSSCPICTDNTCDVVNQKWCNNGAWSVIDYCNNCGNVDVSCNEECLNSACDTNKREWCNEGEWEESNYCVQCSSIDSSCYFGCSNNACDTSSKKWCKDGKWTDEGYCDQDICGAKDVSCGLACESSLTKQVCDTTDNRWCNMIFWATLNYCNKCQDSECMVACEDNACDVSAKKWCDKGVWEEMDYCGTCGEIDASCAVACVENVCDITSNKRCANELWEFKNYCDYCSLKDSDCTISCAEGECDTINKKVCKDGEWGEESFDTLCVVEVIIKNCNDYGNCTIGDVCMNDEECSSSLCLNDRCAEPTCNNDEENGNETDVDCGGNQCEKCSNNKTCKINSDCLSDFCDSGKCKVADTCSDGKLNGDETGVDCGGYCPNKCRLSQTCELDEDCDTGLVCYEQVCVEEEEEEEVREEEEEEEVREEEREEVEEEEREEVEEEVIKDKDEDGILDDWELKHGLDPDNPLDINLDFDEDGLVNIQEYNYGTNPKKKDSDGDGISDKKEIDEGTDPLDLESKPEGAFGILILIMGVLIILGAGGYGVYYYFTKPGAKVPGFLSEYIGQKPPEAEEEARYIPEPIAPKAPLKRILRKPPEKRKIGIVENRRMAKRKEREKLLGAFGGRAKPKGGKKLISVAKEKAKIEKIMPGKKKEDIFSKLKLISKKKK